MREDIATFDARNIPKEIRESVEELLFKNKGSFDPKVILTDNLKFPFHTLIIFFLSKCDGLHYLFFSLLKKVKVFL